ncbi:hypothetical protein [Pedobacter terrae]|uniref:hypothetical protein n=1 Tax=Pedobacter terrae TaxID=405671 RepID=UPI002FFC536A
MDVLLDTATDRIKAGATMNADYQKGLLYFKRIADEKRPLKTIVYYTGIITQNRSNSIEVKAWGKVI